MLTLSVYLLFACIFQYANGKDGPIYLNVNPPAQQIEDQFVLPTQSNNNFITQTVYGFLDFTTTIGNTVMVFSPKSSAAPDPPPSTTIINTSFETQIKTTDVQTTEITPTKAFKQIVQPETIIKTEVHVVEGSVSTKLPKFSSKVEIVTSFNQITQAVTSEEKIDDILNEEEVDSEQAIPVGNNLAEPEYDFLSRQPSEFVEESFKVVNIKSTNKPQHRTRTTSDGRKTQAANLKDSHPTGLVTKLGGTVVKDGATTVHETSVIGTYISGKYAQVLQSSSHIYKNNNNKPKISSSPTLRILKTAPPSTLLHNRHRIESTLTKSEEIHSSTVVRASRRPLTTGNFKNRFRAAVKEDESSKQQETLTTSIVQPANNKKPRRNKQKNRRNKPTSRSSSIVFKSSTVTPNTENGYSRRNFKPKIQHSSVESLQTEQTSLYKFKLNRAPGRWQYKTSSKPRINIRKTSGPGEESSALNLPSSSSSSSELITNDISTDSNPRSDLSDLESSGSVSGAVLNNNVSGNEKGLDKIERKHPGETLNVEISTPADFKDTYYEIATIKTPYTFQVGSVRNTRFITVTSTFEKIFEPEPTTTLGSNEPLTENILAPSTRYDQEQNLLESSIATLSPLYLSLDGETPALETKIETFSTTQEILKTHILPIIRNESNTTTMTLIQTYHITRFVTATKTLPPIEAYQFVPSKRLKEFNSKLDEAGSELNIELDFGDEHENDEDNVPSRLLPESDIEEIGSDLDLIDVKRLQENIPRPIKKKKNPSKEEIIQPNNNLSPDQLQQLALLRLLNPAAAAQLPQFLTTSKPILKLETIYESHVIPIFNGHTTSFSTISRPISTVRKTEYEFGTSTLQPLPIPQQMNPLFPQQFHITTAPIITQTVVTETRSKILKLTFGAKTAYTTLFSTSVIPTVLTTFITQSIQVQPSAAFPGYFPAPFAPYPFVG